MTLRTTALSALGSALLLACACGTGSAPTGVAQPPSGGFDAKEGSASESSDASPPPAPASAPQPGSGEGAAPAEEGRKAPPADAEAESRPGLATLWGEDRGSSMRFTSFLRATPRTPFTMTTLFYNDREGVQAMARQSGVSDFGDSGRIENGFVTVRLLDGDGDALQGFEVGSRAYVVGEPGERYTLAIENKTNARIEAVATVDGLDVIDGRPGTFEKRGYLIDPFGKLEIEGFRRSMDTVAAFRFGSVKDSYAAKKGDARNVGLIGVAFFHEQGSDPRWSPEEVRRRHDANPFPGRFAEPAGQ